MRSGPPLWGFLAAWRAILNVLGHSREAVGVSISVAAAGVRVRFVAPEILGGASLTESSAQPNRAPAISMLFLPRLCFFVSHQISGSSAAVGASRGMERAALRRWASGSRQ